jgi:hypothetical protein
MIAEIPLSILIGILIAVAMGAQATLWILERRRKRAGIGTNPDSPGTKRQVGK